ncbi:MAG: isopenicillin N synthase-like dioxygenase [Paracoccaceae bacterium]|jgi:isopenicillin N synthase-like dioxygenase
MPTNFPIFDLDAFGVADGAGKIVLARDLDQICRETGFLAVGNHGVPQDTINSVWAETERFFRQPQSQKQRTRAPYAGYPYGYLGPGSEALAASRGIATPPDLKESFNGGPLAIPTGEIDSAALEFCYAETIWPPEMPEFRTAWRAYYCEMEALAGRIMQACAVALALPEDYFAPFIDAPISALRALNYPAQTLPPEPGQLRAGAHSDYGSLTILLPQSGSRGLEILSPTGEWSEVPPIPDAFVVNIGDLMARWTNDRWVSTLHRVVNDGSQKSRQSLAFFHQPNWSAEIETLPSCVEPGQKLAYQKVYAGPYLMDKFRSTSKG